MVMENKSFLSKPPTGATIATPNDGEVHLTPKTSSTGAEGTIFYDSDDDHIYVATEA